MTNEVTHIVLSLVLFLLQTPAKDYKVPLTCDILSLPHITLFWTTDNCLHHCGATVIQ